MLVAVSLLVTSCSNLAGRPSISDGSDFVGSADPARGGLTDPVVARIDGEPVRLSELEQWLKDDWFRQIEHDPIKRYELHRAGIDGVIDDNLIERAAGKAGLSSDAYLGRETAALGPISDSEIDRFYDRYRDRLEPLEPLDALRPKIREFLESDRAVRVMTELRRHAQIEILLEVPPPPPVDRVRIPEGGASRGPADAPVTIVEFSDYQCPYCQRTEITLHQLDQLFPGKLRFVYRHFPLDFHQNARPAALAAVCAEHQARFWDYHDLLFANQRSLANEDLLRYAGQLGLDPSTFERCLTADSTQQRIDEDLAVAKSVGAKATPTFFINGIMLRGAQGLQAFRSIIDLELASDGAH